MPLDQLLEMWIAVAAIVVVIAVGLGMRNRGNRTF